MTDTPLAGRRVTLTFDNGPTAGVTDAVLDVLGAEGVPATFFVVGTRLRAPGGRQLVERARREGHLIGHHSTTHTVLLGVADDPEAAVAAEIADLAPDLEPFDGPVKLYRPYAAGGVLDGRVLSAAAVRHLELHGYTCVLWNSVPHDWDDPDGWVARALADVRAQPWTVVVLHDVGTGAMAHLRDFIVAGRALGAEFVQAFPESCAPIRDGRRAGPLSHLMPAALAS